MAIYLAVALAPVNGRIGVDAAAAATVKGSPETFDLAGLRLGMTEAEVERIIRDRGMTVRRKTRAGRSKIACAT